MQSDSPVANLLENYHEFMSTPVNLQLASINTVVRNKFENFNDLSEFNQCYERKALGIFVCLNSLLGL